jgi:hypothetical protein
VTRVLVVSGDPLGAKVAGPGIRVMEMAQALARAGLDVTVAAPPTSGDVAGTAGIAPALATDSLRTITYDARGERLREAAVDADAVVVSGLVLAQQPFLAALDTPLVVDLYAPFVLENLPAGDLGGSGAAGRRRRHAGDVAALNWQLGRGDFFVCASEGQRDFWLGCLTSVGRVNPATYAADPELRRLIDLVPFGLPAEPPAKRRPALRGVVPGIGDTDPIVLWAGGMWDWLDPGTLVRAVDRVRRQREDVRLVFMGSRSPNPGVPPPRAVEDTRRLSGELGLLGTSVFVLDDWVPYHERADYLLEADVGASLHLPHVETRFAFRTRLLDYIWTGLPMVLTEGDVLSRRVSERGLGRVVPPGDDDAVAAAIADLLDSPGGRKGLEPSFAAMRGEMTWSRAVGPLVAYLEAPLRAPDRPAPGAEPGAMAPTPVAALPARAWEVLREGGPLLLLEEAARYVRWRRRPR